MYFEFDEEQALWHKTVHDFVDREFGREYYRECDQERRYPYELYKRLVELGWIGIMVATYSDGRTYRIDTNIKPMGSSIDNSQARWAYESAKENDNLKRVIKVLKWKVCNLRGELAEVKSSKSCIMSSYRNVVKEQNKEIEDLKRKLKELELELKEKVVYEITIKLPLTIEEGSDGNYYVKKSLK